MVDINPVLPADPNTMLPPAVRAAAERAKELHQQAYGEQPPVQTDGEEQPLPVEVTPPPTPQPSPPTEDDESWEKRYKAMKGRYEKEVPRLKDQINTLVGDINNMRGVLATMEARPSQPPERTEVRTPRKLITAEEEADYGEEFFTVVEKKARELIEPLSEQYEERLKGLETQIKGVGSQIVQTSVERMERELDTSVPDWRALNADWENNGFKEWLQLPDPYSGAIRHNLLNTAYERCDTPRVAAFFKGFHAEVAATAPDGGEPHRAITTGKVPLTSFAAPGRAKSAAPSGPAEKPIITRAQISQFYDDINAGRYRGRDAERSDNERMIFEAQREGRIR